MTKNRIAAFSLSFLCVFGNAWAADQCDPKKSPDLLSNDHPKRVLAMKACLNAHKELITEDKNLAQFIGPVTRLATYGPTEKLSSMTSKTPQQSWDFQVALIQRREERTAMGNFPTHTAQEITKARKIAADNSDLVDIFEAWKKDGANPKDQSYRIAAFSKLYPRFIDHLDKGFADTGIKKNTEQVAGEKLGDKLDLGFDSTAGMGIYFALDGVDSAEHIRGEAAALVCPVAGLEIVDTDNPDVYADLQKARILNPAEVRTAQAAPYVSPTGKNLWAMPSDMEEAAQGLMISFRPGKRMADKKMFPYIVDKKAMDYRKCWPIKLSDFQQCNRFERLLTNNFGNSSIFDMLKKDTPTFDKDFFAYWSGCNKEGKAATVKAVFASPGGKQLLTSEPGKTYLTAQKKDFDALLKEAGCTQATNGVITCK